jgi:hypothetical protein
VLSDLQLLLPEIGWARQVAAHKESGVMKFHEGKAAVSYAAYTLFCCAARAQDDDFLLFASCHCFITLNWALINRSITTASTAMIHLKVDNDCLTVNSGRHKGDQSGKKGFVAHVYANPLEPDICPILSMAVMIFTRGAIKKPSNSVESPLLFGSPRMEKRFSDFLGKIAKSLREDLLNVGVTPEDIGTHTWRKSPMSFLMQIEGGPHTMSAMMRGGWDTGVTQR